MEAGRELDAEIAEKVMGWRREKRHYTYVGDRIVLVPPFKPEKKNVYGYRYGIHINGLWVAHQMPEFSTNIADAWTVVERMQSMPDDTFGDFARALSDSDGCSYLHQSTAAEAAERICRAALSALRAAGGESETAQEAPGDSKNSEGYPR